MKKSLLLVMAMKILLAVSAQKAGIEQYLSYTSSVNEVEHPTLFFTQYRRNIITEIRYNYEAENALSVNAGKAFSFEKNKFSYTVRPMIGATVGSIVGFNVNMDQEIEINKLYISSKLQYFFSLQAECQSFFYTWIEGGICFTEKFYGGISLQMDIVHKLPCEVSKGFVLGFSSGRWDFPVYIFDPTSRHKSITAGILYDISFQKRAR